DRRNARSRLRAAARGRGSSYRLFAAAEGDRFPARLLPRRLLARRRNRAPALTGPRSHCDLAVGGAGDRGGDVRGALARARTAAPAVVPSRSVGGTRRAA